jgi:fructose/tagatose bisphosphate aldolase
MRAKEAALDIARVAAIRQQVTVPLVLHGSSGVTEASIVAAIGHGIAKVNVATYLNEAFVEGMRRGLAMYPDEVDPRKSLEMARDAVKERVREKIRLFKSSGRINSSGGFASPPSQRRSGELGSVE